MERVNIIIGIVIQIVKDKDNVHFIIKRKLWTQM